MSVEDDTDFCDVSWSCSSSHSSGRNQQSISLRIQTDEDNDYCILDQETSTAQVSRSESNSTTEFSRGKPHAVHSSLSSKILSITTLSHTPSGSTILSNRSEEDDFPNHHTVNNDDDIEVDENICPTNHETTKYTWDDESRKLPVMGINDAVVYRRNIPGDPEALQGVAESSSVAVTSYVEDSGNDNVMNVQSNTIQYNTSFLEEPEDVNNQSHIGSRRNTNEEILNITSQAEEIVGSYLESLQRPEREDQLLDGTRSFLHHLNILRLQYQNVGQNHSPNQRNRRVETHQGINEQIHDDVNIASNRSNGVRRPPLLWRGDGSSELPVTGQERPDEEYRFNDIAMDYSYTGHQVPLDRKTILEQLKTDLNKSIVSKIDHSSKFVDDVYEYRFVILPRYHPWFGLDIDEHLREPLMNEDEWRLLGIGHTRGWEHYGYSRHESNVFLFRRALGTDPKTGKLAFSSMSTVGERIRLLEELKNELEETRLSMSQYADGPTSFSRRKNTKIKADTRINSGPSTVVPLVSTVSGSMFDYASMMQQQHQLLHAVGSIERTTTVNTLTARHLAAVIRSGEVYPQPTTEFIDLPNDDGIWNIDDIDPDMTKECFINDIDWLYASLHMPLYPVS